VRAFAKCKVPSHLSQATSGGFLEGTTHLVVSAGSKMQAHLFAWSDHTLKLRHLCRFNQQVFHKKNRTGKKEFGL